MATFRSHTQEMQFFQDAGAATEARPYGLAGSIYNFAVGAFTSVIAALRVRRTFLTR
jgi:hypothetical protein